MAMLVEPTRSIPAWSLLAPDSLDHLCEAPTAWSAGDHSVGVCRAGGDEPDSSPLRAAVVAACAHLHGDPDFAFWLREVVRKLDDPAS